ncbi:MAG: hypothetical protein U9P07_04250 [Pseudomonadota bacterium]|nr:hypothetical protein [Pseudomonadota bacterium]
MSARSLLKLTLVPVSLLLSLNLCFGAQVSGTVTNGMNPVANIRVEAHTDKCWPEGDYSFSADTDDYGNYSINVTAGSYYIYVYSNNANGDYLGGWWN